MNPILHTINLKCRCAWQSFHETWPRGTFSAPLERAAMVLEYTNTYLEN